MDDDNDDDGDDLFRAMVYQWQTMTGIIIFSVPNIQWAIKSMNLILMPLFNFRQNLQKNYIQSNNLKEVSDYIKQNPETEIHQSWTSETAEYQWTQSNIYEGVNLHKKVKNR